MEVNGSDSWSTDLQLIQSTLEGDSRSVDTLLARMVCIPRFIHRLNSQQAHVLSPESVKEAGQETFLRVWRDRASFTGNSKLETWVCGYARNVFLESVRERSQREHGREDLADAAPDLSVDQKIDEFVGTKLEAERIRGCLDRMPHDQAAVIRARLIDGESFADMADRTGEKRAALKARYYRAIQRIAKELENGSPAPPASPNGQSAKPSADGAGTASAAGIKRPAPGIQKGEQQ